MTEHGVFGLPAPATGNRANFHNDFPTSNQNHQLHENKHNISLSEDDTGYDNNNGYNKSQDYFTDKDHEGENYREQSDVIPVAQRLHTDHALHPLSRDEYITYTSLLTGDDHAEVFVMPNHRVDLSGNLRGFRLVVDRASDCVLLPITREIFMGSTCVECDPGNKDIHPDVTKLLSHPEEIRSKILNMLQEIAATPPSDTVSLAHMPVYGDTEAIAVSADDNCTGKERSQILLDNLIADRIGHHSTTMRGRDSRPWKCDMPKSVGVYHAHVRSRDSGRRHHKLFIIASGGCRRACEQFYNMNLDLLGNATAHELESCEEAWWLRRTCTRSRCRTVQMVADALKLDVPNTRDIFAFEETISLPVFTVDTLDHDLTETDDGRVALLNECCDSTQILNGIGCTLHPTEGVWIFQGSQKSSVGTLSNFGGVFGQQDVCGAFPTGTFTILEEDYQHQNYSHRSGCAKKVIRESLSVQDGNTNGKHKIQDTRLNLYKEQVCQHVLYFDPVTGKEVVDIDWDNRQQFVKFDESFLKHLESHDWCREYQIIELIPIINAVEFSKI
jgi:hypothetical protein